uniref:Uncharacterized protein n=1 Tax=Anopheles darlingi TaxID=43151 RepID=A0A2M4D709_ANODA
MLQSLRLVSRYGDASVLYLCVCVCVCISVCMCARGAVEFLYYLYYLFNLVPKSDWKPETLIHIIPLNYF